MTDLASTSHYTTSSFKPVKLATPAKAPSHPGGAHGFIDNLVHDAADMAVGLPAGIVHTVEHPISTAEMMGKQTWHDWSPLFQGHVHEWAHNFYQHPLGPILDIVSLATLPLGGIGAGIKVGEGLGMISREARIAQAFKQGVEGVTQRTISREGEGTVYRTFSSNPTTRVVQKALAGAGNANIKGLGRFGDQRYAERALQYDRSSAASTSNHLASNLIRTAQKLVKKGKVTSPGEFLVPMAEHVHDSVLRMARETDPLAGSGAGGAFLPGENGLVNGRSWINKAPDFSKLHMPVDTSAAEVKKFYESLSKELATKDPLQSLTRNGKSLSIPDVALKKFTEEAHNSMDVLQKLWNRPTQVWKWLILASAPRYFVNNVIGNALMVSMATNPVKLVRAMYDTYASTKGPDAALAHLNEVERAMAHASGGWESNVGSAHRGFAMDAFDPATGGLKLSEREGALGTASRFAKGGLYGVTHHISDTIPRRIIMNAKIREHALYQAEYTRQRNRGIDRTTAHYRAARNVTKDKAVADWLDGQVSDVLGQYVHYNRAERKLKGVVPFYGWIRAITRHTGAMARERPIQAALMGGIGKIGVEDTVNSLGGNIPDFMRGDLPLEALGLKSDSFGSGIWSMLLGGRSAGRTKALRTAGLNPYATVADIAKAGESLVQGNPQVGEDLGGLIHPFIAKGIEHVTGQSLISGARINRQGGLIQDVLTRTVEDTTQAKMIDQLVHGRPHPSPNKRTGAVTPFMYAKDQRENLMAFLGIPVKDESIQAAVKLANQQKGISTSGTKLTVKKPRATKIGVKHKRHTRRVYRSALGRHSYKARLPRKPYVDSKGRFHV